MRTILHSFVRLLPTDSRPFVARGSFKPVPPHGIQHLTGKRSTWYTVGQHRINPAAGTQGRLSAFPTSLNVGGIWIYPVYNLCRVKGRQAVEAAALRTSLHPVAMIRAVPVNPFEVGATVGQAFISKSSGLTDPRISCGDLPAWALSDVPST
jgi:hypothetical protein